MKIYYNIEDFQNVSFPVLTTGTFDGVHLGHKTILDRLKSVARENDGESVLLTFSPHPRIVLFPEQNDLKLLTTREEKKEREGEKGEKRKRKKKKGKKKEKKKGKKKKKRKERKGKRGEKRWEKEKGGKEKRRKERGKEGKEKEG